IGPADVRGASAAIDDARAGRAFSRAVSTALSFAQVEWPAQVEVARTLFREYEAWLKVDLCFQRFEEELAALPMPYGPPGRGLLAVEESGGGGGGAVRPLAEGACELKRMFLRAAFRGKGSGRKLANSLIDLARAAGHRSMRLDTFDFMREAVMLYQSLGFRRIERYYNNPHPGALFFELELR